MTDDPADGHLGGHVGLIPPVAAGADWIESVVGAEFLEERGLGVGAGGDEEVGAPAEDSGQDLDAVKAVVQEEQVVGLDVAQEPQEQGAIIGLGRSQAERDGAAGSQFIQDDGLNERRPLASAAAVRPEAGPEGLGQAEGGAVGDEEAQAVPAAQVQGEALTGMLHELTPKTHQGLEGENAPGTDRRPRPTRGTPETCWGQSFISH